MTNDDGIKLAMAGDTEKWLSLDDAIKLITEAWGSIGAAQAALIQACGSGKVRSRELYPEHGGDSWPFLIPAAHWKNSDAHIDLTTGLVILAGETYGSRIAFEPQGRDAEGFDILHASMARVEISEPDLLHWLGMERVAPLPGNPLDEAIRRALAGGKNPGRTTSWKEFEKDIRGELDKKGVSYNRSEKTIKRHVKKLRGY